MTDIGATTNSNYTEDQLHTAGHLVEIQRTFAIARADITCTNFWQAVAILADAMLRIRGKQQSPDHEFFTQMFVDQFKTYQNVASETAGDTTLSDEERMQLALASAKSVGASGKGN